MFFKEEYVLRYWLWRFGVLYSYSGIKMEDIRISIRLTKEEHIALKIISAKSGKSIQDMMSDEIKKIIKQNKYDEK